MGDPEAYRAGVGYREVFERCLFDVLELTGKEIVKDIKWFEVILFITSSNRVTKCLEGWP